MEISRARAFTPAPAVTPLASFTPREGYVLRETEEGGEPFPYVIAACSRERFTALFERSMETLGEILNIRIDRDDDALWTRHNMDGVAFRSMVYDYERLLLEDGDLIVSVMDEKEDNEIQICEMRMLWFYGRKLRAFMRRLEECGVIRNDNQRLLCDVVCSINSYDEAEEDFQRFTLDLGAELDDQEEELWDFENQ